MEVDKLQSVFYVHIRQLFLEHELQREIKFKFRI